MVTSAESTRPLLTSITRYAIRRSRLYDIADKQVNILPAGTDPAHPPVHHEAPVHPAPIQLHNTSDIEPHHLNVAPEPLPAPTKASVHIPESGEHEAEELKKQTKQAGKEVKKTGEQAGKEVKKTAEQAEKKGQEFVSQAEKKGKELANEAEKKGKEFSKKAKVCLSLAWSCDVTDCRRRRSRRSSLNLVHTGRKQRTLSSDPVLLVV